jgi:hypothetical protein
MFQQAVAKYFLMFLKVSLATTLLVFVAYQTYAAMSRDTTPSQPYRIVEKIGDLEIRYYPSAVTATVHKSGAYRDRMNAGFRDLASYIFGGNERQEAIAMTTPVIAVPDTAGGADISFVMPEDFDFDKRPAPTRARNIQFRRTEPAYTASIEFGGFASESKMQEKSEVLFAALQRAGLQPRGAVRHLYYNAPFDLFDRRNEVLVELTAYPTGRGQ